MHVLERDGVMARTNEQPEHIVGCMLSVDTGALGARVLEWPFKLALVEHLAVQARLRVRLRRAQSELAREAHRGREHLGVHEVLEQLRRLEVGVQLPA